eukprot:scaffold7328_cov314-Pinguiococcus_pyrenoidosus.AAC.69
MISRFRRISWLPLPSARGNVLPDPLAGLRPWDFQASANTWKRPSTPPQVPLPLRNTEAPVELRRSFHAAPV